MRYLPVRCPLLTLLALSFLTALAACGDDDAPGNDNQNQNQNQANAICGNGRVESGEECDDGAQNSDIAPDACRASCTLPSCGDWVMDTGEECDDGPQNSDSVPDACRASCHLPSCGDGVVDVVNGESCDDGNDEAGDGCGPTCKAEYCGNGELDPGEVCDDGNYQPGDGCSPDCQSDESCGNGMVDVSAGEECDDGNTDAGDGCSPECLAEYCGNGRQDPGEVCDDGNQDPTDGCTPDCISDGTCGNGYVDVSMGEACDCGADPMSLPVGCAALNGDPASACSVDCQTRYCGNGRLDPGELCDDGNNRAGDGCSPDCLSDESCGNGHLDAAVGEECDDGNDDDGDGCNMLCRIERCGNGYLEPGELCDDGNNQHGDGCSVDCLSDETCGNGYLDFLMGEQCDDGNLLGKDGCDSRCRYETPTWTERRVTEAPEARMDSAMAYDAGRGVLVLYGGWGSGSIMGDTWEWSGGAWRRIIPPQSPGPRAYHQMVYDAARKRVVLFGGGSFLFWLTDSSIWEWDGKTWTQRSAAIQPPPRTYHQLAYDAARKRVVLQGGFWYDLVNDVPVYVLETWEWDGLAGQWTLASPGPVSAVNDRNFMAYDPRRGVSVLLDHGAASTGDATTWEWDGAQWVQSGALLPAAAKPVMAMSYHSGLGRVVLHGTGTWAFDGAAWQDLGLAVVPPIHEEVSHVRYLAVAQDPSGGRVFYLYNSGLDFLIHDLWALDVSGWSLVPPAVAPPARYRGGMAFDDSRGRAVLFGGGTGPSTQLDDTWEWNGLSWEERLPAHRPLARWDLSMAYDQARERVLMFGGRTGSSSNLSDTWLWDGEDWQQASPAQAPSARLDAAMAYDPGRDRMVLFGGLSGMELGDTWEWDGATWTEVLPSTSPPARFTAALAYDPALGALLLHGGCDITYFPKGDTWAFDGQTWVKLGEDTAVAREGHSMDLYRLTGQVLLFGGSLTATPTDNTYRWNGSRFEDLQPSSVPPKLSNPTMVFDPLRGEMVLLVGLSESISAFTDTWVFSWSSPRAIYEVCESGMDLDNDGLVGCDDPDCEAWCSSCGDGICDPVEGCRLCPGDCGDCQVCGDFFCDPGETCASCPGDCGPC